VESRKTEVPTLDIASPPATGWLERIFKLRQHGSTVKTELIAGVTTFITMAYIIFVNPNIMADAGIDHGAAFVATCIAAALGCLLMGLYANWPVGLAPGMGLNAFFTYTVVGTMGYNWETALGAVFISGVLFMFLTLSKVREWLLNSIPVSLRHAMGAGVGLFLGLIGLKTAGIIVDSPATLIKLGSLHEPGPLLAAVCFLLIAILSYKRVFGAILISIIGVTLAGWGLGLVKFGGVVSMPPSLAPTWMAMDVAGVFNVSMISVVLAFLFVHMFDTAGTLMGVAQRANLVAPEGPQGRQCVERVWRRGRRAAGHQLCGKRSGGGRRGSHRPDGGGSGRAVHRRHVLRTAGRHDPGLCHRRCLDLCRDADDGQHGAHQLGRGDRQHSGDRHRDHDATDVLGGRWHCAGLHQLRGIEGRYG